MSAKANYLREWRLFRGFTQEQVIDRLTELDDAQLPQTGASLSRLETGKQPYAQRILEALAAIYGTTPESLIGRDPTKEGRVIDIVARLNDRQREQAAAILEALASSG